MKQLLIWILIILWVVGYCLESLGVDTEPQREESFYYENCKCRYNFEDVILPFRAPDEREEKIFKGLMKRHGIPFDRYILCATNKEIPHSFAGFATVYKGLRYIVYDREYAVNADPVYVVQLFGHEIGHQYLDHVSNSTNSWEEEIEADEFSGWSLFKSGYGHSQSLNLISPTKEATEYHPPGKVQREAVGRGWLQAYKHARRKR